MDLSRAASYFDRQTFDTFVNGVWTPATFTGQLKDADYFTALWHRSTRRRVLTVAPDQEPAAKVMRPNGLETDVYLIGGFSRDANFGEHYRTTCPIHRCAGLGQVVRLAPAGPANDPGWDVESVVENNYIDRELRTQQNDPQAELEVQGNFYIFLPLDSLARDEDIVVFEGRRYLIEESYNDAGFLSCRTTDTPDMRLDLVYRKRGPDVYENGTVTQQFTPFNVTMYPDIAKREDASDKDAIVNGEVRFVIRQRNIGFEPQINDEIVYEGRNRAVKSVGFDALSREWYVGTLA